MDYERLMKRALQLAKRAEGETAHYPMVGALLVKNGEIISQGYFKKPGEPHAEVKAIEKAGSNARGATLILNLEPCAHYGTTPPCTEAIIRAGIKKVVAGMIDPNPLVCGKGFKRLRSAGIEVVSGVLEKESRWLNRHFVKYITTGLPWVILKLASTIDGKIADRFGNSKWISGEEARKYVHQLRKKVQVVMVGIDTVLKDDPQLTVRLVPTKNQPRALVIDSRLKIPLSAQVLSRSGTIIACRSDARTNKQKQLKKIGAEIITTTSDSSGKVNLRQLMRKLGKKKIASLLCEGGAHLAGELLEQGLVDELHFIFAPLLLPDGKSLPLTMGKAPWKLNRAISLYQPGFRRLGKDFLFTALLREV